MTGENPPSEERPEFCGPFGRDEEITELFHRLANRATDEAFTALFEGDDTNKVASALLNNGSLLHSLGYKAHAEELIAMFEDMRLKESQETAGLFSKYRLLRLEQLISLGRDPSDPLIQGIVTEQESSEFQNGVTSADIYFRLAEQGDATSFAKWFHVQSEIFQTATDQESEFSPFPVFPYIDQFRALIADILNRAHYWIDEERTTPPEADTEMLKGLIDAIDIEFNNSSRKALFAERMQLIVKHISRHPMPDVSIPTQTLYIRMLEEGAESSHDRIGERVTESRLHKRLILELAQLIIDDSLAPRIDKIFTSWVQSGLLDERDLQKISTWKTEAIQAIERQKNPRK
ncbi:hypothetical protein CYG49_03750 [Candidatus Saccharibacteria bacterium]|nr:MAG: hypothetical protein CYG49_03750 [Candidatus Saccharibacteria bacterium]